ncbi:MAG TPA: L,D-transpeptidase [Candidatus Aminicenantes bacterium]|nr:L,D-transpeptidase [Candidatus Aminicenantes bacterium]
MNKKKTARALVLLLAAVLVAVEAVAIIVAWPKQAAEAAAGAETNDQKAAARLDAETAALRKRIGALAPKAAHIIIDSARNTLTLKTGKEVRLQAVVSCGSGSILEEPGGKRTWIFDTPRGEFQVKSKVVDPTWVKPDWAFIEEGKEIPKKQEERLEAGVLGDYALGFGDGYFIHGTLYSRLLGRSVTHGCVRVGDKDLKAIFQAASIGTRIYIY